MKIKLYEFRDILPLILHFKFFNMKTNFLICFFVVLPLSVVGCGDKGPAVYFVTGTVYLDDEPFPECRVVFTPKDASSGTDASGRTDDQGVYKIQTLHGKADGGTTPGEYVVSFNKMNISWDGKSYVPSSTPAEDPIKDTRSEEALPQIYISQRTSPESATVTKNAKENVFDFHLKSK